MDDQMVDDWTLSASSSAANHPVTEIQESSPKLTWRSTTPGSAAWIQGVRGSNPVENLYGATGTAALVVINHNIWDPNDSLGFSLQIWGTAPNNPWIGGDQMNLAPPTSTIETIRPYRIRVYYIPVDIVNIYQWRVTFDAVPWSYHEVGRVFLCQAFQPKINFRDEGSGGAAIFQVDNTTVTKSPGEDQFSDNRPKHRSLILDFPPLADDADAENWLRLIHVKGKRETIFFDPYPDKIETGVVGIERTKNLISQVYGRMSNQMGTAFSCGKLLMHGSRINVEEAL